MTKLTQVLALQCLNWLHHTMTNPHTLSNMWFDGKLLETFCVVAMGLNLGIASLKQSRVCLQLAVMYKNYPKDH